MAAPANRSPQSFDSTFKECLGNLSSSDAAIACRAFSDALTRLALHDAPPRKKRPPEQLKVLRNLYLATLYFGVHVKLGTTEAAVRTQLRLDPKDWATRNRGLKILSISTNAGWPADWWHQLRACNIYFPSTPSKTLIETTLAIALAQNITAFSSSFLIYHADVAVDNDGPAEVHFASLRTYRQSLPAAPDRDGNSSAAQDPESDPALHIHKVQREVVVHKPSILRDPASSTPPLACTTRRAT